MSRARKALRSLVAALATLALGCFAESPPRSVEAGRLGHVEVFHPEPPPKALVFLISDTSGFDSDLEDEAQDLAENGIAVVGIDLPRYLKGLAASRDGCHYVVGELEALSQRLQRDLGFDHYASPLLVGVGAGGTLAYAALAQSPAATVGGAVAIDAAPSLATRVPLCPGAVSHPAPGGGFSYEPRADLPAPFREATDESVEDALAPLLEGEEAQPPAELAGLPIVELPVAGSSKLFAVIYSGDGGWRDLDKTIGGILEERGVPVVGVDSLRYFWQEKTPDDVARDLAAILRTYRTRFGASRVILAGYSFGADILPFAYNRLPDRERSMVVEISLLGVEATASFEFHVSGWLGAEGETTRPVLPELLRIDPARVQCFYGEEEDDTLCRAPELAATERIETTGGHHFDGDYAGLATRILDGAEKRMAQAH